ncbi:hypothetical protein RRG08_019459 [Elysia crispata]|uniref:Uncharacterized protein n=1 Tax=Elysia crispata TaxID=231223 RepID=A0AAE1AEQ3_9GAST|nr:hypothetical protein RRG08_019459 [Elysia crispata]
MRRRREKRWNERMNRRRRKRNPKLMEGAIQVTEKTLPHLRNPEILIGENDLTSLSYLNEPEVLYNLKVRFVEQNLIYTYCVLYNLKVRFVEQNLIYTYCGKFCHQMCAR